MPAGVRPLDELEDRISDALAEVSCSLVWRDGALEVCVSEEDGEEAREALREAGITGVAERAESDRDWVAESAALRQAVTVGRYVLDPHDHVPGGFSIPGGIRRLHLPATTAFGTGSHESTRLALRLLLLEDLRGRRVLDVGCGLGTLAFVAGLEGGEYTVGLDLDPDAVFAARWLARRNAVPRLGLLVGGVAALAREERFDVVVANLLLEEAAPLLGDLALRLVPGGHLLSAGLLTARSAEWDALLAAHDLGVVRRLEENEWLGTVAETRG